VLQIRTDEKDSPGSAPVASLLTGPARRRMASLRAASGLAAIRDLARQAWADEADWSAAPASATSAPVTPLGDEERARVLLEALIAAAKVDRGPDGLRQLTSEAAQLGGEEQAFILGLLERPPILDDVARRLKTRAETIEVYAASCLAADANRPLSRHYLDMLAARLGLERALVGRMEQTIAADGEQARESAPALRQVS
jgi:uncharacterized membrane protein YebE (DUF533 family)